MSHFEREELENPFLQLSATLSHQVYQFWEDNIEHYLRTAGQYTANLRHVGSDMVDTIHFLKILALEESKSHVKHVNKQMQIHFYIKLSQVSKSK